MAAKTKISWADSTCNLWIGCVEISPACDHCYARELAERYGWTNWGGPRIRCAQGWKDARKFQRAANDNGGVDPELGRRRRVFINSLSDFFDNHKTILWREEAWQLIRECPDVIFILLTKRPENIRKMLPADWGDGWDNVWIGTTIEDQERANHRLPHLLAVPAAVYWVSMEPLLGEVDLRRIELKGTSWLLDALTGVVYMRDDATLAELKVQHPLALQPLRKIGCVVTGGESGNHARLSHPAWFDRLRDDSFATSTPFFFKQWGEWISVRDLPEDVTDKLYHPAPRRNPEATRRCKVPQAVLQLDGRTEDFFHNGAMLMFRAGRARDPETLKGKQHLEFPQDRRLAA